MRLKIKKSGSFKFSKKYLDLIAKTKVYDVAEKTPISFAGNLSSKLKNEVYLKREDMQPIFSFKIRVMNTWDFAIIIYFQTAIFGNWWCGRQ